MEGLSKAELQSFSAWYARTRALPQELQTLLSEIQHLEQRLAELELERIDVEAALATRLQRRDVLLGKKRPTPTACPTIQGQVLFVAETSTGQQVAINRGSNEGVEIGTTFEIYREATYKGRIEVIEVHTDSCIGRVLLAPHPMQRGDQATTRL